MFDATKLPTPGLIEPIVAPLCPECDGETIFRRCSVKKITRAERDAQEPAREMWRLQQRALGRFVVSIKTDGWDEDKAGDRWTADRVEAWVCNSCDFTAKDGRPFIEARKRKWADEERAKEAEFDRTSALPVDDLDHWCWYCESNCYDGDSCEKCDGAGCDDCEQHGYWGYSW